MQLLFRWVDEDEPGPKWSGLWREYWPGYRAWWLREGASARPSFTAGRRAIGLHMPEILDLYDRTIEAAGGGDLEARFLSYWCPPPYLSGCSQAIWPGLAPVMIRNYDYDAEAFDGVVLKARWDGVATIATTDGLLGCVDGMNAAGLAVSLTFGGRKALGEGFGVPLILRYVLQTCERAEEAAETLARIPCHMSYNVTVLDAERDYRTVFLAPDREPVVQKTAVATNHQERVEWRSHARFTATVERERYLLNRLRTRKEPLEKFTAAFLRPPLYSLAFKVGFGTLYTAAYGPAERTVTHHWPDHRVAQTFDGFEEQSVAVILPEETVGA